MTARPFPLGRHVEHDPRSLSYPAPAAPEPVPEPEPAAPAEAPPAAPIDPVKQQLLVAIENVRVNANALNDQRAAAAKDAVDASA